MSYRIVVASLVGAVMLSLLTVLLVRLVLGYSTDLSRDQYLAAAGIVAFLSYALTTIIGASPWADIYMALNRFLGRMPPPPPAE